MNQTAHDIVAILVDLKQQLEQLSQLQADLSELFAEGNGPEQMQKLDQLLRDTHQLNLQLVETETERLKWLQTTGESEMGIALDKHLDQADQDRAAQTWEETRALLPELDERMSVNRATLNRLDQVFENRINLLFGSQEDQRPTYDVGGMARSGDRSRSIGEA